MASTPVYTLSEFELISSIKNGDQYVFNYLYKNYAAAVYAVINKIIADEHTSEDVLQEVFVKIWSRIDQFNPEKGRLFTWIVNIARNAAKDVLRTNGEKMRQNSVCDDVMHDMTMHKAHNTDTIGIRSLIARLKPEQQVVLEMAYYKGYTTIDIARALYIPEGTVKTRIRYGLKSLRSSFHYTNALAVA